ncbi:hypothetical protein [Kordiimonas aquimaris]|uniref:hypothetical protein n=1 Tax=Kordiimonas aquimaris TaxID=707591 RepID=UPI0021D145F4|nr:hypothetical protein [Kordiimonas aquimaris]
MKKPPMTERMKRRELRRDKKRETQPERHPVYGSSRPNQTVAFFDWFPVFRSLLK